MDIQKQIEYWRNSCEEDLEAGKSLLEKCHFRHSLFLAHLAIEKMLKANVTRNTREIPPRIHNLERLAEIANLNPSPEQRRILAEFGIYQMAGRYPDPAQAPIDSETAKRDFSLAEEIVKWLKSQL